MVEVQSLTQDMGRAVKSLSTLLKSEPTPRGRHGLPAQPQPAGTTAGQGKEEDACQKLKSPSVSQGVQENGVQNGVQVPSHLSPTPIQTTSAQDDPYLEADDDYV